MRQWAVIAAYLLGGCDRVFGLTEDFDANPLVDGDPNKDTDEDTIFDDRDNCRFLANPDQHDEEDDGVGDVCDNCPHVANNSQRNIDGVEDDLGDACDADTTTIECIVYFDGFGTLLPQDSANLGSWTLENDMLVQPDPGFGNALWIVESTLRQAPLAITRVHVRSDTPSNQYRTVGFLQVMSDTFTNKFPHVAFVAELSNTRAPNGTTDIAALHVAHFTAFNASNDLFFQDLAPPTPMQMAAADIQMDLRSSLVSVWSKHQSSELTAVVAPFSELAQGRLGLRASELAAAFEYVLVIETKPRCN